MKNILKTSLYFMAFAFAGILFQIGCSNSDEATSVAANNTLLDEKIVYMKKDFATNEQSIWTCNLDGSAQTQIPISLPSDLTFYTLYTSAEHSTARLSQDGQTLLFTVQKAGMSGETYIYSCNLDGTNLQEVVALEANVGVFL